MDIELQKIIALSLVSYILFKVAQDSENVNAITTFMVLIGFLTLGTLVVKTFMFVF